MTELMKSQVIFVKIIQKHIDVKATSSLMLSLLKGESKMSIGQRLRNARHNMNMTLKDMSDVLGVSPNSIYRWEHDLVVPRKETLGKMAELFQVSVKWLLYGVTSEDSISANMDNSFEHKLLSICRRLSEGSKYQILGYAERVWLEEMNVENQEITRHKYPAAFG
jgi:transcriptional regulator with XRE-family HTH domain